MLQYILGGLLSEVDQFKQLDPVPLRREDQFMLFSVKPHLKGYISEHPVQGLPHLAHNLFPLRPALVFIHAPAQLALDLGKVPPPIFGPLPEALLKLRQGNSLFAVVDKSLRILIPGESLQRLLEIGQGPPLLIQIIVGIAHAKVPPVVFCKKFLKGP